jgi:hypothetical protein
MIGIISSVMRVSLEPQALLFLRYSIPPSFHPVRARRSSSRPSSRARDSGGVCQAGRGARRSVGIDPRGTFAAGSPFRWVVEKAASHPIAGGV